MIASKANDANNKKEVNDQNEANGGKVESSMSYLVAESTPNKANKRKGKGKK